MFVILCGLSNARENLGLKTLSEDAACFGAKASPNDWPPQPEGRSKPEHKQVDQIKNARQNANKQPSKIHIHKLSNFADRNEINIGALFCPAQAMIRLEPSTAKNALLKIA